MAAEKQSPITSTLLNEWINDEYKLYGRFGLQFFNRRQVFFN